MKKMLLFQLFLFTATSTFSQNVGIGTATPNASAAVDIQNTSKGILIPRMTTAQRNAIASPATGLLVFDNTIGSFWFKSSGNWVELVDTAKNIWKKNGTNAYLGSGGNVGLGTSVPTYDLHINRPSPSVGFFDAGKNKFSGSVSGDSSNLVINAYRSSVAGATGDLLLQINGSGQPLPDIAGNVGIGISNPMQKLSVKGNLGLYTGDDLLGYLADSDGDLLINAKAGTLISGDPPQNIILQLHSGFATSGKIGIGTNDPVEKIDIAGNLRVSGKINRQATGTANMIPIAYGRINADGTIAAGTGNFNLLHTANTGLYFISMPGESLNSTTAFGIATVVQEFSDRVYCIKAQPGPASFVFTISSDTVNYSYDDDTGIYYVSSIIPGRIDAPFIFAIYRL
ncbi:MAG TPA: hypothetical protein VIZ28_05190 [Chitinophagaceae bacterium]